MKKELEAEREKTDQLSSQKMSLQRKMESLQQDLSRKVQVLSITWVSRSHVLMLFLSSCSLYSRLPCTFVMQSRPDGRLEAVEKLNEDLTRRLQQAQAELRLMQEHVRGPASVVNRVVAGGMWGVRGGTSEEGPLFCA